MANPFAKSRPVGQPYAIYRAGDMTWHVCKTYKTPANEAKDQYARWFVWAKSPMTYGDFEGGDTYALEVKRYGQLVAAEPAWLEAHGIPKAGRPTPAEYLDHPVRHRGGRSTKRNKAMTIRKFLEVSTGNITPNTMEKIESRGLKVSTMSGPYGAFVYVLDDAELERQLITEADLLPVLAEARKNGCDWIYFDPDRDPLEGLKDYTDMWV